MKQASYKELKEYLSHCIVTPEAKNELLGYLDDCFERCVITLSLIDEKKKIRILELGSNPYFLTILIKKILKHKVVCANYFGEKSLRGVQRINCETTKEKFEFRYDNFNVEVDRMPYPDKSFDFVLFCEILEHLVQNPVYALSEIHRVLKDGGFLVITTPNVARASNILKLIKSQNIYDPYSGYGCYGRHNREYSSDELVELLESTGFEINTLLIEDIHAKEQLKEFGDLRYKEHIFIKARKKPEFKWFFPQWLFRSMYNLRIVKDNYVKMGSNDLVQIGEGWNDLEDWGRLGYVRWSQKSSGLYLKTTGKEEMLKVDVYSGPKELGSKRLELLVYSTNEDLVEKRLLNHEYFDLEPNKWCTLVLRLSKRKAGEIIKVKLVTKPWKPSEVLGSHDGRDLGIAVKAAYLE